MKLSCFIHWNEILCTCKMTEEQAFIDLQMNTNLRNYQLLYNDFMKQKVLQLTSLQYSISLYFG